MMRDLLSDLTDFFPYCLFALLPIFIALSPINPVDAANEFPVHRLAHYELGGTPFGSKMAAVTLDARALGTTSVLRKIIVAKLQDLSVSGFNELVSSGAAGVLILVPRLPLSLTPEIRESALSLEEHLLGGEYEIPVYFTEETDELLELLEVLKSDGTAPDQAKSAAQAMLTSISSSGYQLVSSLSTPKAQPDNGVTTIQGQLIGKGEEDTLPTIVVVAHYDASGAAPGLSFGADSNGSGVTILMELARLWHKMYSATRTHAKYNIVFVLSGGGKVNYYGTKKWLEEHLDNDHNSELLTNVPYIVCLDTLGQTDNINVHVSKPPKDDNTPNGKFITNLRSVAEHLFPEVKVEMVHKKINLADDVLAWEHERFSIRRLPAFTLSHLQQSHVPEHNSILDVTVSEDVIARNIRLIAETLACTVYEMEDCDGQVFNESLGPLDNFISSWSSFFLKTPRAASLLVGGKNQPIVSVLKESLQQYVHETKMLVSKRDKREPEFVFYDGQQTNMNSYKVKPAIFDLVLTLCIGSYLGLVYLMLIKSAVAVEFLTSLTVKKAKAEVNGNHKLKSH